MVLILCTRWVTRIFVYNIVCVSSWVARGFVCIMYMVSDTWFCLHYIHAEWPIVLIMLCTCSLQLSDTWFGLHHGRVAAAECYVLQEQQHCCAVVAAAARPCGLRYNLLTNVILLTCHISSRYFSVVGRVPCTTSSRPVHNFQSSWGPWHDPWARRNDPFFFWGGMMADPFLTWVRSKVKPSYSRVVPSCSRVVLSYSRRLNKCQQLSQSIRRGKNTILSDLHNPDGWLCLLLSGDN